MGPIVNDNPPNEDKMNCLSMEDSVNSMQVGVSDSEDEAEDPADFGYQPLSQDPFNDSEISESSFQSTAEDPQPKEDCLNTNQESCMADRLTLDSEHIEVIKSSMAGFTLPPASIPAWANVIPEDQWKSQLFSMINNKNCDENCKFTFQEDVEVPAGEHCSSTKSRGNCGCREIN